MFPAFEIGPYRITVLSTNTMALDGGAMFGVVPKTIWNTLTPSDAQNRIKLACNCLLIEYSAAGQHELCLLDTGVGNKFNPKMQAVYGVDNTPITYYLQQAGFKPQQITKLLFTHLHFDHAGGATQFDTHGQAVPVFEHAEVYVNSVEWQHAVRPHVKTKASYQSENFLPLQQAGKLTLLKDPKTEILPGMWLIVTGGHTEGHQILVIDRPEGGLIYWGDIIPTQHHLKIPYVMAYDLYPMDTMAQKQAWLQHAHERQWITIFEHDIDLTGCQLRYDEVRHCYVPRPLTLPV
jgi:glyoxylase-like metal-dependent hydrolase (beta-lactamase superfamily II)